MSDLHNHNEHEPLSGPSPWQSLDARQNTFSSSEQEFHSIPADKTADSGSVNDPPASVPSDVPRDATPPRTPKKRGAWLKVGIAALLAAAIAFGSGYAGVSIAYRNMDRVVIRQNTGSASGGVAAAEGALTSEQVAEKTVPSVVAIITEGMTTNNFWFGSQVVSGAGSGVILSEDGYILTNYHVVGTASSISVELSDGTTHKATLVGSYADGDLAVIKIDATGLTPVTFADSDAVKQGAAVYAVGNPEGTFSDSITSGIISALDRTITVSQEDSSGQNSYNPFGGFFGQSNTKTVDLNVFQFDAAVSPGNSGGGLFDASGALIGIVCAKSSDTSAEGLSFAIPGNTANTVAESLISSGSYTPEGGSAKSDDQQPSINTNRAVLGISASTFTAEQAQQYGLSKAGVYVVSIQMPSASEAGLAVGDRIISIDGVIVEQTSDVTDYLAEKAPGDTVELSVERSGQMVTCSVPLQENGDAA